YLTPKSAADYLARGQRHTRLGWFDLALRDFDEAVRLEPDNANARLARGLERFRRGRWAAAAEDFTPATAAWPRYEPVWFRRAWAYSEIDRLADAVADLKVIAGMPSVPVEDRAAFLVLRSVWNDRLGRPVDAAADRLVADLLASTAGRARAANKIAWLVLTNP